MYMFFLIKKNRTFIIGSIDFNKLANLKTPIKNTITINEEKKLTIRKRLKTPTQTHLG